MENKNEKFCEMGIAHEPSGAKPSPCHNLTLGSIGRKYYLPGWCIVVAWVWAHERAVRFGHLLVTKTMQGGRKGRPLSRRSSDHAVHLLAMNEMLDSFCWPFEITLYSNSYQSSLSNVNRLRIDPICPKLAEWEREKGIFSIFKKRREGEEIGAEEGKSHSPTKFKGRGGCWSRSEGIQHQGTHVFRRWSCQLRHTDEGHYVEWGGRWGLDNQGKRVRQLSYSMKQS